MPEPRWKWIRDSLRRLWARLGGRAGDSRPSDRLAPIGPTLRFAGFELELETGHLSRDGEAVKIQPQPARVLQYLAERAGALVTRDDLRVLLWGEDHHVNFDQGLNFCIQQVRQALDDSAKTPTFIETIPRRGYRFLVPVERVGEIEGEEEPPSRPPRS
ncbi:MAG: winged helix-turn-helix domain-containing protein [Thermoanaerobaculia bacterium]